MANRKQQDGEKKAAEKNRELVVVKAEKYFDIPGKMTAVSLELPSAMEYEEWSPAIVKLAQIHDASNFWIGDALNFGEGHYGEMYSQAASETGIREDRLVILKYVSLHVIPASRIKEATWSHHREVASLEPEKQTEWLEKSVKNNWTVRELKEAMGKKNLKEPESSNEDTGMCLCCGESAAVVAVCLRCQAMAKVALTDRKRQESKPKKARKKADEIAPVEQIVVDKDFT